MRLQQDELVMCFSVILRHVPGEEHIRKVQRFYFVVDNPEYRSGQALKLMRIIASGVDNIGCRIPGRCTGRDKAGDFDEMLPLFKMYAVW
jgi:hypothetical protein